MSGGSVPAFPRAATWSPDGQHLVGQQAGMTLRDWFAGQALAGAMAQHGSYGIGNGPAEIAARMYEIADALLSARSEGGEK